MNNEKQSKKMGKIVEQAHFRSYADDQSAHEPGSTPLVHTRGDANYTHKETVLHTHHNS